MTTQQKINYAFAAALLALAALLFFKGRSDTAADKQVLAAAIRAERAVAVLSADTARLNQRTRTLTKEVAEIKTQQTQLQIKILLNSKRNEIINKNIDTLNGRLGIRPRF